MATTIGDLTPLFNPLAQALQSEKGDALANSLLSRSLFTKPITLPTPPSLSFDTPNAEGIGGGIVSGLGNALNNTLKLRAYGQQQQQAQQYAQQQADLARQFDLAMAAKQQKADLAAAQQQQQEATVLAGLSPEAQAAYYLQDKTGRREILNNRIAPDLAPFKGQAKGIEAKAGAQGIGEADATQQTAKVQQLVDFLQKSGVNVNTPQGHNLFQVLFGFTPTTQTDLNLKQAQTSKAQTEAGAAPTLAAQQIEQNNVQIQAIRMGNVLKNIAIHFEPARLKSLIEGQQLGNAEKADKLERIDTAMRIFNEYQERLARGEVTPRDIAAVQSRIGMLQNLTPELDTTLKNVLGIKPDQPLKKEDLQGLFPIPMVKKDVGKAKGNAPTGSKTAKPRSAEVNRYFQLGQLLSARVRKGEKPTQAERDEYYTLKLKYGKEYAGQDLWTGPFSKEVEDNPLLYAPHNLGIFGTEGIRDNPLLYAPHDLGIFGTKGRRDYPYDPRIFGTIGIFGTKGRRDYPFLYAPHNLDLGGLTTEKKAVGQKAAAVSSKKKEAQRNFNTADKRLREEEDLQRRYQAAEKEASEQLKTVDKLLKKYGGL